MPIRRIVVEESSDEDECGSPRDAGMGESTASKRKKIVIDDSDDDGSGGLQSVLSETSEEDDGDDDHDGDSGDGGESSDNWPASGDSDDGVDPDTLDGFIAPDDDEASDEYDDASGSESEEGEAGEEGEASDEQRGQGTAKSGAPSRTREQILQAVRRVEGWDVSNGVVYRTSLGKHAHDGRARGSYPAILVPELCKVLGYEAMNKELMEEGKPVFFEGLDVQCCYMLAKDERSVIGCLCTQTPSRGGLTKIFEVKHGPSGISFLMGRCCANFSSGRDMREEEYEFSDAGGLRGRLCTPCDLVF